MKFGLAAWALLIAVTASASESPAALELVEPALLSSPLHTVRPEVTLVGPLAQFEIDTPFGELEAPSVDLLAVRVEELTALEKIAAISKGEMYLKAARAAGSRTARAIGTVVRNPVETARGLPEGIKRLFTRKVDSAKRQARDLGDRATDAARDRPDYAGQPLQAQRAEDEKTSDANQTGERAGRAARGFALDYIGYDKARRNAAKLLAIDPYTSNPILNQKLDDLAWASLAGDFSFGKALGALTGGATEVISRTVQINEVVWERSPEEVREYNAEKLKALKLDGPQARKFLRNSTFNPTLQTALVKALEDLGPLLGRTDVLDFAGSIENELEARFVLHALYMLEAKARAGTRLYALKPRANALLADTWDGHVLLPMPVDYLTDQPEVRDWLRGTLQAPAGTRVLVSGFIAPSGESMLKALNLVSEAEVPYPERPGFARG
jgi:hypothetical protein